MEPTHAPAAPDDVAATSHTRICTRTCNFQKDLSYKLFPLKQGQYSDLVTKHSTTTWLCNNPEVNNQIEQLVEGSGMDPSLWLAIGAFQP